MATPLEGLHKTYAVVFDSNCIFNQFAGFGKRAVEILSPPAPQEPAP
jgi:hypothetical protein